MASTGDGCDLPATVTHSPRASTWLQQQQRYCVDDATILCLRTSVSTEFNLQSCASSISDWCKPNQQVLNASKMAVMLIVGPRSTPKLFSVNIGNVTIDQVESKKILGVTIDSRLSFHDHSTNVRKLALWHLSTLRRISPYCDVELRKTFYNSFLYPHFIYCYVSLYLCSCS